MSTRVSFHGALQVVPDILVMQITLTCPVCCADFDGR